MARQEEVAARSRSTQEDAKERQHEVERLRVQLAHHHEELVLRTVEEARERQRDVERLRAQLLQQKEELAARLLELRRELAAELGKDLAAEMAAVTEKLPLDVQRVRAEAQNTSKRADAVEELVCQVRDHVGRLQGAAAADRAALARSTDEARAYADSVWSRVEGRVLRLERALGPPGRGHGEGAASPALGPQALDAEARARTEDLMRSVEALVGRGKAFGSSPLRERPGSEDPRHWLLQTPGTPGSLGASVDESKILAELKQFCVQVLTLVETSQSSESLTKRGLTLDVARMDKEIKALKLCIAPLVRGGACFGAPSRAGSLHVPVGVDWRGQAPAGQVARVEGVPVSVEELSPSRSAGCRLVPAWPSRAASRQGSPGGKLGTPRQSSAFVPAAGGASSPCIMSGSRMPIEQDMRASPGVLEARTLRVPRSATADGACPASAFAIGLVVSPMGSPVSSTSQSGGPGSSASAGGSTAACGGGAASVGSLGGPGGPGMVRRLPTSHSPVPRRVPPPAAVATGAMPGSPVPAPPGISAPLAAQLIRASV